MDNQKPLVFITGASRGIGLATAHLFAKNGWRVAAVARDINALRELEAGHPAQTILPLRCDLLDRASRYKLCQDWIESGLAIDAIVHNAGAGRFLSLEETTDETWADTLELNLTAPMHLTRELLPALKATAGVSTCVCVSSIAAVRGFAMCTAYAAAKGGLLAWSNALREEMRGRMRVTTLMPGATNSAFWDAQAGEWDRTKMMQCQTIAETIYHIVNLPGEATIEQMTLMPAGGAL